MGWGEKRKDAKEAPAHCAALRALSLTFPI
jgi:hypothetical protein